MIRDCISFIRELPRSFSSIGAMVPSSSELGRDMVRPLSELTGPRKILEVGAGTGPITREILRSMGPQDTLVICEINQRFLNFLKQRLNRNTDFQHHRDRIQFFEGSCQDLAARDPEMKYDVIVSSLPFYSFGPTLVNEFLSLFRSMLSPNGTLTFCSYIGVPEISLVLCNPDIRRRVVGVEKVIKQWCDDTARIGRVDRRRAFLNIPPAYSYCFAYTGRNGTNGTSSHRQ